MKNQKLLTVSSIKTLKHTTTYANKAIEKFNKSGWILKEFKVSANVERLDNNGKRAEVHFITLLFEKPNSNNKPIDDSNH